jgi:putative tricarboxylic transport membrane protein
MEAKHPGSAALLAIAVLAIPAPFMFKGLRRFKAEDA